MSSMKIELTLELVGLKKVISAYIFEFRTSNK
jgi:hypothetical protein